MKNNMMNLLSRQYGAYCENVDCRLYVRICPWIGEYLKERYRMKLLLILYENNEL